MKSQEKSNQLEHKNQQRKTNMLDAQEQTKAEAEEAGTREGRRRLRGKLDN